MDEDEYLQVAEIALRKIVDGFEDIDPDEADLESSGDVITITFPSGKRCVVNTQRPSRQIWLAGAQRAWHFSYESTGGRWMDDKGTGTELFQAISDLVKDGSGVTLALK